MHWWSYNCLAKAWRQRHCHEKWAVSTENWFVTTKCGQCGQCCIICLSPTFRCIHYPEGVVICQEHLRTLPTLLHCRTVSEQRLFSSLSTMAFAKCYWISSGFVAGPLGFRHLLLFCASVPVSNYVSHLHLQNGRKAEFRLERDVMRRKMLKTVSFGVSCQGFNR